MSDFFKRHSCHYGNVMVCYPGHFSYAYKQIANLSFSTLTLFSNNQHEHGFAYRINYHTKCLVFAAARPG